MAKTETASGSEAFLFSFVHRNMKECMAAAEEGLKVAKNHIYYENHFFLSVLQTCFSFRHFIV